MKVRPLTMTDCEAAGAIVGKHALWRDRYGYDAEAAGRDLLYAVSHGDTVFGAFENSTLCGFAWFIEKGAFARSPYLRLIAVDPTAQSRGIGAALLTAGEDKFRAKSKFLFLLVSDFNDRGQKFYREQGYEQMGALPNFVLEGTAELLFGKKLR